MTGNMSKLRALLILGRVSNLPTVWSNCLAGWLLGGGGEWGRFAVLCLGATLLYIGGMFLNDAFDAGFDREHRPERPIPSGAISEQEAWVWGCFWLDSGTIILEKKKKSGAFLALLLACCILLYDAVHKRTSLAPLIMAGCRLLLYLVSAAVAVYGLSGLAVWSGVVMAAYIAGLSYIARTESVPGPLRYWPCLLLAAPLVLALIVNDGSYLTETAPLMAALVVWTVWSLGDILWKPVKTPGRAVAGLLAGIVWVDMLALGGEAGLFMAAFAGLFVAARFFQRFIPAT